MLKDILEAVNHIFGMRRDIEGCKADIKRLDDDVSELQREVRQLSLAVERLTVEVQHSKQHTEDAHKNLLLQLEVLFLKTNRPLPPADETKAIE